MKKFALVTLLVVIAPVIIFSTAFPKTFLVPSRYKTIERGIMAASRGDTVLVGPGVYKENLVLRKSVSLVSTAGAAKTIVDGGGRNVVLRCEQVDSMATIEGFTFRNGVGVHGGGMLLSSSFPKVIHNVFTADSATYGGGLCVLWSNSMIKDNVFVGNRASYGGAIYTMFIAPSIDSNTIEGNRAQIGGGIYLARSSEARVTGNIIVGNKAERGGGAFLNGASPVLEGNLFRRNSAQEGGAISSMVSSGVIRKNTIWENTGSNGAAMALLDTEAPDIENNTLVGNSAPDSLCSGIYSSFIYARVVNNILVGNAPGFAFYCVDGATPVLSCNILWENGTGDYFGVVTDVHDIKEDPLFSAPAKGDFSLRKGSPAVGGPCGLLGAHGQAPDAAEGGKK